MAAVAPYLRVGVDVGGTNTDGVILDPSCLNEPQNSILSWHKVPTTDDPSKGIEAVVTSLLAKASIDASKIASVTIGTTHFINAVVEKDQNRLAPVAVIRLCGPFGRDIHPGMDWPSELRNLIVARTFYCAGGLEVDGRLIQPINTNEIYTATIAIRSSGIRSIVVIGTFSPADVEQGQEERVRDIILDVYPEADVVISKEVANLGFIERENAAILNASILDFARKTIGAFQRAMQRLKMPKNCSLFLTQNDGTILPAHLAAKLPIRTFNSGPTNSMCGAAFLVNSVGNEDHLLSSTKREPLLVLDIGGTTTDVGMLVASGFPRQAASYVEISGVRMNFSCPDVKSIGLGGGSIVRTRENKVTIGPDSVGHQIQRKALVFGGDTATATDYTVAAASTLLHPIGNVSQVSKLDQEDIKMYQQTVKRMLEAVIDKMKTSSGDITVILVGGGAIIAPNELAGTSKVIKPEFATVANAIGAAIARVSGTVDMVVDTAGKSMKEVIDKVSEIAIERAVDNGAKRETITIAEMDSIPLQYIADKSRVIVKIVGDFDSSKSYPQPDSTVGLSLTDENLLGKKPLEKSSKEVQRIDIASYKPTVVNREWLVNEIDLEWISTGCYILGTGGGGTPYPHFIRVREMLRNGALIKVINPDDLKDDDIIACGGGAGSPTVSIEKLAGDEMMEAQQMVYNYTGTSPTAVIALEIGGGNGIQGLLLGASTNMNIPVIDGDWMGRAYPTCWQITPVVAEGLNKAIFLPSSIADGNGNRMLMTGAASQVMIERAFRAALSEMGSHVGFANGPWSGLKTRLACIQHTISLAWRIGRAVHLCRQKHNIDAVADDIINEVGGDNSAKVLFRGKIVSVERKLVRGHAYGEIVIEAAETHTAKDDNNFLRGEKSQPRCVMKIPFKNENILATIHGVGDGEQVVASVPDLITVLDAQNGEALGTPDYRYGLLVIVLGMTASDRWTSTPLGIEIGGPKAFDFSVEYKPLGVFKKPLSVIDEYSGRSQL